MPIVTDMATWLNDFGERIYRYGVYRRMFTPYEQQESFADESIYEDGDYQLCKIEEAVNLGNGDYMLGLREIDEDGQVFDSLRYVRLSEIRLCCREVDQKIELYKIDDTEEQE